MRTQAEIRADLTLKIVEALKQGIIPWRKPWRSIPDPVRLPTNFVTKKHYQGVNIPLLWLAQHQHGWPAGYFASFQQWRAAGAHVRKGEKATPIVFWRKVTKAVKDENGQDQEETFPLLRTWGVFNVAQVEGPVAEPFQVTTAPTGARFEGVDRTEFDQVVAATKADIRFGGNQPMYVRPPGDYILMPHEEQFHDFPSYAETLFHELAGHWTEWRTAWTGSYAEGELRAEIAACFLTAALGIPHSDDLTNHLAYVQSWIQALENDPKFILRASAAAARGVDFVLGFSRPQQKAGDEQDSEQVVEAA